jgi:CHAD domain-containing protein
VAKAKHIPGLSAADPYRVAAAKVVETRAGELFEQAENVLDTEDIERVHDMRVASRRLRAVLEIFAPCFPKATHRDVLRDVKALADALGERRDPDVHIDALRAQAAAMGPEEQAGIEHLISRFAAEQAAGNATLAEALADAERSDLRGRLRALADQARGRDAGANGAGG